MPRDPEELIPLKPDVYHILLCLADGDIHGFGIMQQVADRTYGQVKLQAGALYRHLKNLLSDGLIVELDQRVTGDDDQRRRHYRLTKFGRKVLSLEARRMSALVDAARVRKLIPESGK